MGWNEPEKGKDPSGGKNQPPDLDEALKRFQEKFKKLLGGGSATSTSSQPESNRGNGLLLLMGLVVAFIIWVLSGIFIVDPAEQAVILRFGRYIETVGPGPHWIPRFIDSKKVRNVERVHAYSYSAQMLTQDESLVAVSLVVQYRISDLKEYLYNVADPQKTLQQATSSALRQVVGTTTFDQIITEGREAWGNNVQETLIKILALYKAGINVVNVSPQPARAPENVQDAFDDAIKAREDEKRFKEQALAYQARVVPIAEGNAKRILEEAQAYVQQVTLQAKGDVAEFLALLPEYKLAPSVMTERLYLETMQKVLSQSSKIVMDSKSSNLIYLPLDKFLSNDTLLPKIPALSANKELGANETGEASLMTERNTARRTYSLGGYTQ